MLSKLLKSFGNEKQGLKVLNSSVTDLPGFGTELAELVLSHENPFVGENLAACVDRLNEKYRVALISARVHSNPEGDGSLAEENGTAVKIDAKSRILSAGDALLCLVKSSDLQDLYENKDFYVVTVVGSVPRPITYYGMVPLFVFLLLICLVAAEELSMCAAALSASAFFFMGGWIKPKEIPDLIDIRLLMLLGCSISFAKAMSTSGLSGDIAGLITGMDASPLACLFVVYGITAIITALISNNAAAALMYPIAVSMADKLDVSFKPFAMIVVISASATFASPIGYQTHIMVWGPGGYKFLDFVKFGIFPTFLYMVGACLLAPLLFPF